LEAERQEKEAEEAGEPEADLMEDRRGELSREHSREQSEGGEKRIMKDRTLKERLGDMVPPAAGETCAAVATDDHRLSFLGGYTRGQ
jgi:hypothetical protein